LWMIFSIARIILIRDLKERCLSLSLTVSAESLRQV
jgi:hypothetical protein